jgi:hypothetical protein
VTHPYARAAYAEALAGAEGGSILEMPAWPGFAILRPVRGGLIDAVGPYPRTPLGSACDLDLDRLREAGAVSVVMVPDPMHAPPEPALALAFEHCRPFKTHFVADRRAPGAWPSKHHRYKIRKARRGCQVERVRLGEVMADWTRLYAGLARRHAISGAADFTAAYFTVLAGDPAFETFVARQDGQIVAMAIWFEYDGVAVYHLGASDAAGYAVGASYAIFDAAFERFAAAQRFDFGGAAGVEAQADDGLARFKQGFANTETMACVCGSVLDPAAYARLTAGLPPTSYFPAYRAPMSRATAAA